jgi:serine/threonine protein kinase
MAPEVVKKSGHGKPADVWSLGCCVIEMLTAKPPWFEHGKSAKVIMNLIKTATEPPTYPDNISDACRDFLNHCFILNKSKRPTAIELLIHPFVTCKFFNTK